MLKYGFAHVHVLHIVTKKVEKRGMGMRLPLVCSLVPRSPLEALLAAVEEGHGKKIPRVFHG